MTTPVVYTSLFGSRFGIQRSASGASQLIVHGVAVTSPGSSETATFGNIQNTPGSFFYNTSSAGIVAGSGGGSSVAVQLGSAFNILGTVAATSDSAQLPAGVVGMEVEVFNEGANTAAIFPKVGSTDIINALTTGVSFALGTSRLASFSYMATGKWKSQSSPASS